MKIYNAKNASVQLPLGMRRLVISGRSLSQEFMPTSQFLQMIARTFTPDDLALIVSGGWEGNMCAEIPTLSEYCVSSVEQAIARFNPPEEETKEEESKPEPKKEKEVEEPAPNETPEPDGINCPEAEPVAKPKKPRKTRAPMKSTGKKKAAEEEKSAEE